MESAENGTCPQLFSAAIGVAFPSAIPASGVLKSHLGRVAPAVLAIIGKRRNSEHLAVRRLFRELRLRRGSPVERVDPTIPVTANGTGWSVEFGPGL
jgi:hypothetical protein